MAGRSLLLAAVAALLAAALWQCFGSSSRALGAESTAARFPLAFNPLIEQDQALAPAAEEGQARFGSSVAVSVDGSTALIGAPGARGMTGSVWVFTRTGSTWTQQGPKLTLPEAGGEPEGTQCEECGFGSAVAVSADGNTALIGAPRESVQAGAAWVFTRSGGVWSHRERLTGGAEEAGKGLFGRSVALSADGNTALIGDPTDGANRGSAWVFKLPQEPGAAPHVVRPITREETAEGHFGRSVALSLDGATALIGGPSDSQKTGAAWVFTGSDTEWTQQGPKLTGAGEAGEGRFGFSVALSASGDTALIGGREDEGGAGAVWPFARSGSAWAPQGPKLTGGQESGPGEFGYSATLSADGNTALIGGPRDSAGSGAGWAFSRAGGSWTQAGEKLAAGLAGFRSSFGASVALASNGDAAVIGAPHNNVEVGEAWTFLGIPAPPPASPPTKTTGGETTSTTPSTTTTPSSGVLASIAAALPSPTLAATGNLMPVSGLVRVKLPGSGRFVPLTSGQQVPFGTTVDATNGRVSVTTASPHGGTQTANFYTGEFKLTQGHDGVTLATLAGGNRSLCPTVTRRSHRTHADTDGDGDDVRAHASRRRAVRKLWAQGHGSYSTKGSYATGAALGTQWLTEDLCEGTLITVVTDKVKVTDLVTHRHVTVRAGHSYLAKAP